MTAKISRSETTISLGDDQVRIEEGPARKTATATEELLSDDKTDARYYAGVRPVDITLRNGEVVTVDQVGRDALGKPIEVGKKMTYLDHGGREQPGSRCFWIMVKRPIDPTKETLENGDRNPHFVPEHVRAGALLDPDAPPNRTHYTYIFEIADTVDIPSADPEAREAAEQAAIERGQELLAELGA